jgi:WhiB family transcriptional regulator, redox-sensing transcriptional regulator
MERSRMPDMKFHDSESVQLLPIVMPAPTAPSLGEWPGRGLCVGEDTEVFFPSGGDPGTDAREICAACRVRDECLNYAIDADEFGIWGGLDQDERRNKRRRQRRKAAAVCGKARQSEGAA